MTPTLADLAAAVRAERAAEETYDAAHHALRDALDAAVRAKGRQPPRVARAARERADAATAAWSVATDALSALLARCP